MGQRRLHFNSPGVNTCVSTPGPRLIRMLSEPNRFLRLWHHACRVNDFGARLPWQGFLWMAARSAGVDGIRPGDREFGTRRLLADIETVVELRERYPR